MPYFLRSLTTYLQRLTQDVFLALIPLLLLLYTLEIVKPGFVANVIKINLFIKIGLILGFLLLLQGKQRTTTHQRRKSDSKWSYAWITVISLLSSIILSHQNQGQGILSIPIAVITFGLVFILGKLTLQTDD